MAHRADTNPCVHKYREALPGVGETLAKLYKETLKEPNPADMQRLLDKMK